MSEPRITVNGVTLTEAQAMALRVAASNFLKELNVIGIFLQKEGLENEKHGEEYKVRLGEILRIMNHPDTEG